METRWKLSCASRLAAGSSRSRGGGPRHDASLALRLLERATGNDCGVANRVADIWGQRTAFARGGAWPKRVDQALADGVAEADVERWVRSACVLCSNGVSTGAEAVCVATEHDLYHLCHTLAKQCDWQAQALAAHAERHAADVPDHVDEGPRTSLLDPLRRATAAVVGRSPMTGFRSEERRVG